MGVLLRQAQLPKFLALLMQDCRLIAPLARPSDNEVVFEEVARQKDLARLDLLRIPQFTAKGQFMPAYEDLFAYDMANQAITDRKVKRKQRILFGLHLCDLNAIKIQDKLFLGAQYVDDHYKAARESVFLVGWYCNTAPSKFCFCESMKLTNYYDLMLRDKGDGNISVDVGSEKGEALLKKAKSLALPEFTEPVPPIRTQKHLETHDIRRFWDHPKWKETADEKCLSCQRCTLMCPTCMCFDIYDVTTTDLHHGVRQRTWDSCHATQFTRVAGNHVFRPDRTAKFKHRVYHKIAYYPEVFGSPMCTGCGRCIEFCPTEIDFVQLLNEMNAQK